MTPATPTPRLRILLFSSLYPSSARPGHGIFVETRLRELLTTGAVEARVVAPVPWFYSTDPRRGEHAAMARTPARELWHGIEVLHPRYLLAPKVGMSIAPFVMAAGAYRTLRCLPSEGFDFDLIDAHYYYPDGVAAALLARRLGRPLVITARGSDVNQIAGFALPRRLMRWAARQADTSIAVSRALAARMAEIGMPPERIRVLRNGVDMARFTPLPQAESRRRLGWPAAPTLLAVGHLVENKGQQIAIEALTALPEFHLGVVGAGPQAAALKALADRIGVADRVRFCGRVEHADLPAYYSAADMLVLPSSREGSPNVVLESMACGTPVVATAIGGVPELIDAPEAGVLIADRTAGSMARGVRALWSRGIDRAMVRRHAMRFGWDEATRGQLQVFERLAHARRESGGAPAADSTTHRAGDAR